MKDPHSPLKPGQNQDSGADADVTVAHIQAAKAVPGHITPALWALGQAPHNAYYMYLHLRIPNQADVSRELEHKLALCGFQISYPLENPRRASLHFPACIA